MVVDSYFDFVSMFGGVCLYVGSVDVVVTTLALAVVACLWIVRLLDQLSVV